jgi:hypothetical protein
MMRIPLYISRSGPHIVIPVAIGIVLYIDNIDPVDHRYIVVVADMTAKATHTNILPWAAYPIIGWWSPAHTKADARAKRCPCIIVIIIAPGYPGRRPFAVRYPIPSHIIIISPPAIMEWRPSPAIVRCPCPSVIGIYPMPVGGIRPKAGSYTRYPYITIIRIRYPGSIRA